MNVLVTGATGLLGNNVVRKLLERNEQVRVLVRAGSDPRPLEGLAVCRVEGDVTDARSVARAAESVDAVIHCAGCVRIGWSDLELHRRVNIEGARHVAEAARERAIRLVHVSTINTFGVARKGRVADEEWADRHVVPCPYVATKQAAEAAIDSAIEQGLDAVIVNPGFMLGPWDWKPSSGQMILQVARRWTPLAPVGGVSVCDVRDVAAAIVEALDRGERGRRYVLGGENLRYRELWNLIAEVTGSRGPLLPAGPLQRWIGGAFGDLWGKLSGSEPEVNSAAVKMSSQLHFFSSELARKTFGYQSRPVRQSITDAWNWFVDHGYADRATRR